MKSSNGPAFLLLFLTLQVFAHPEPETQYDVIPNKSQTVALFNNGNKLVAERKNSYSEFTLRGADGNLVPNTKKISSMVSGLMVKNKFIFTGSHCTSIVGSSCMTIAQSLDENGHIEMIRKTACEQKTDQEQCLIPGNSLLEIQPGIVRVSGAAVVRDFDIDLSSVVRELPAKGLVHFNKNPKGQIVGSSRNNTIVAFFDAAGMQEINRVYVADKYNSDGSESHYMNRTGYQKIHWFKNGNFVTWGCPNPEDKDFRYYAKSLVRFFDGKNIQKLTGERICQINDPPHWPFQGLPDGSAAYKDPFTKKEFIIDENGKWRTTETQAPAGNATCARMEQESKIGETCTTTSGYIFERIQNPTNNLSGWKDQSSGLIWYDKMTRLNPSPVEARQFCHKNGNASLPSAHDFEIADDHGLREVLKALKDTDYWAFEPNMRAPDFTYNGKYGVIQQPFYFDGKGAVCIGK